MKTKKKSKKKKGFTLIELLVVIAIIAILSVVVVLTLNPAEMLRRSRDSNRASDLSIIKTSISLYLADVSSTSMGTSTYCYMQWSGPVQSSTYEFSTSTSETSGPLTQVQLTTSGSFPCGFWFASNASNTASTVYVVTSSLRSIGPTLGWIPINLSAISAGTPIGQWPADPAWSAGSACTTAPCNGNAGHFYSYIPGSSNNSYKLAAKMESTLYSASGTSDLETTDGGVDPNMYEQGTNLSL
jgi:prepilin-type N-terminal cleavage/methylation domain-containing protein